MMNYKQYVGKVEYDDETGVYYGVVIDLSNVINIEGRSVAELRQALVDSVDGYLEGCIGNVEASEHLYSGKFLLQIPTKLQQQIQVRAKLAGKSFNSWVCDVLETAITQIESPAPQMIPSDI